jgi:hypothetical protein
VIPVEVQQFLNANPVLVIIGLFIIGIIVILAVRILLSSAGCLLRLGCAVVLIVGIFLLARFLFFHF